MEDALQQLIHLDSSSVLLAHYFPNFHIIRLCYQFQREVLVLILLYNKTHFRYKLISDVISSGNIFLVILVVSIGKRYP